MSQNKRLLVGLGIIVSAVFLFFAFRNLHFEDFAARLRSVHVGWLAAGALVYFAAVAVIAWRWNFLLRAIKRVPLGALAAIVAIGYMGNNVYPLRAGEALRIFLLRRNHHVTVAKATTTVVVERAFDGLVMLTFIAVSLLAVDVQSKEIRAVASYATPVFVTAVAVFFLLAARPNVLRRIVALWLPPGKLGAMIAHLSEEVIHGLEGLRSPADLAGAVVSSFVSWGIEASVYWMVMFAFEFNLSYAVALLVVGTVNLAGLIPASPGQLGVYEFFASTVMVAAGVPKSEALAYAVVVHVVIWLPVTLVGFYLLARQGLGWSAVTHARELEGTAAS